MGERPNATQKWEKAPVLHWAMGFKGKGLICPKNVKAETTTSRAFFVAGGGVLKTKMYVQKIKSEAQTHIYTKANAL